MIDRYKIKRTTDSKEIGVMYFVEEKRVKVGCSKSVWRDVDFICQTIWEAQGKAATIGPSQFAGNIYSKELTGIETKPFAEALEKLKALGHLVQPAKALGRILR